MELHKILQESIKTVKKKRSKDVRGTFNVSKGEADKTPKKAPHRSLAEE